MLTPRDTASLHRLMTMLNDPEVYKQTVDSLLRKQEEVVKAMDALLDKEKEIDQKVVRFQATVLQVEADKKLLRDAVSYREKALTEIQNKDADLLSRADKLDVLHKRLVNQERTLNARSTELFNQEAALVKRESVLVDQERAVQAKIAQLTETETALTNRMEKLRSFVAAPV